MMETFSRKNKMVLLIESDKGNVYQIDTTKEENKAILDILILMGGDLKVLDKKFDEIKLYEPNNKRK